MVKVAKVNIWGQYMGAVAWNDDTQYATFQYAPEFVYKGLEVSPICMPLNNSIYSFRMLPKDTFMGLPGLLADSLPDAFGKALLDRWLAANGRTFANPIERLCYQGTRSMGALEFEPAQDVFLEKNTPIEIESLVNIASDILAQRTAFCTNLQTDTHEALANIIRVGTSAGGQRAKAVIAYNEKTGEVRSGQINAPKGFDYWLLKLDGVDNGILGTPKHYGIIEYIYYKMALNAGIEMSECRLLYENGRSHFMTKRFDRQNGKKVHMQTLCGLAHFDYKAYHIYSYEQVFQVMRNLRLSYQEAEQMFRRMVFNIVARNQDDHTKNISFLMNKQGLWSLSPAYDVSWAYNPVGDWTSQHQMSINNKWDDITRDDLIVVANAMHIKRPLEIIQQVVEAVGQWHTLATEFEIPTGTIETINKTLLLNI